MRLPFVIVCCLCTLSGCGGLIGRDAPKVTEGGTVSGGLDGHRVLERTEMMITVVDADAPCTGAHGAQSCMQILLPNGETTLLFDGIAGLKTLPALPARIRVARIRYDPEGFPMDIGTVQYQYLG